MALGQAALLAAHVLVGAGTLLLAPAALLARKGGRRHRAWGELYVGATLAACATAAALSFVRGSYAMLTARFIRTSPETSPAELGLNFGQLAMARISPLFGFITTTDPAIPGGSGASTTPAGSTACRFRPDRAASERPSDFESSCPPRPERPAARRC